MSLRPQVVLAVARSEARLIRRLARYWIFLGLSALMTGFVYLYYGVIHTLFSSFSGTVGSVSPKYLLGQAGMWQLIIFMLGIVFLAFDIRARDERERMSEVLDVRPYSNTEILCGRFLGTLLAAWIPVVILAVLVQLVGAAATVFGWWGGEMVEWRSLFNFVFAMALPGFSIAIATMFVIALVVRNRLVAAIAGVVVLGTNIFVTLRMPIYLLRVVDLTGGFFVFASELAPRFLDPQGFIQRSALLLAAAGLLVLAAAVHPRLDGVARPRRVALGGGLVVVAALGFGVVAWQAITDRQQFERWRTAHEARAEERIAKLDTITGMVRIEPGRQLTSELELGLSAPEDHDLDTLLLSLNPGLRVTKLTDERGAPLEYTFADGLLEVARPLERGSETRLSIETKGKPERFFGYLDSAIRVDSKPVFEAQMMILGFEPSLFERRFVALMPGIRWLPAPGAEVGRQDVRHRAIDYFDLDLVVEVPDDWLVAGPGKRQELEVADGRARFRFAPGAPLPKVALIASRFERRHAEIEGIDMEILISPRHKRNLELFGDAAEEIRNSLSERLRDAAELGLTYPYNGLTLVEVSNRLRAYGGGWQMDTVDSPPAMLLMRETSFPTSRFEFAFRNRQELEEREGGIARAKREALERFFENDFSGDNVFLGAARNFFSYQTAPVGRGADALRFVTDDLTNRLVTGKPGFFSVHIFGNNSAMQTAVAGTITDMQRTGGESIVGSLIRSVTDRPENWNQLLGVSLADMDPREKPDRAVSVLVLKGGAVSRSLADGLGREPAAALLVALKERYRGRTFTVEDFYDVADELGIDLKSLVGEWLDETELPGFIVQESKSFRLADGEGGTPRYQTLLTVKNGEPAPGLLRLRHTTGEGRDRVNHDSEPVFVAGKGAVEIGLVTEQPLTTLTVEPYLSLNRGSFQVALDKPEEDIVEQEPFQGSRPIELMTTGGRDVVVDDLDSGFTVASVSDEGRGLRLGGVGGGLRTEMDQGLPESPFGWFPRVWSRRSVNSAYGRYRHTMAIIRKGDGDRSVGFSSELENAGRWQLAFFVPRGRSGVFQLPRGNGIFHLEVEQGESRHAVEFDASAAEVGWNVLGEYELDRGGVVVKVSNETDKRGVFADAIRWRPLDKKAAAIEDRGETTDG